MPKTMRRMYRLKLEQGWIQEKSHRIVYIDTELSALAGQMVPAAHWHWLMLAATAALYVRLQRQNGQVGAEIPMLGCAAMVVAFLTWAMHLYLVEKRNVVPKSSQSSCIAVSQFSRKNA